MHGSGGQPTHFVARFNLMVATLPTENHVFDISLVATLFEATLQLLFRNFSWKIEQHFERSQVYATPARK